MSQRESGRESERAGEGELVSVSGRKNFEYG